MPQVPVYQREVAQQNTPTPYQNPNLSGDMFGVNVAQAGQNMGRGLSGLADVAMKIRDYTDETKILEYSNKLDKWEQDNLYDKDNGYYYKMGKDASGKGKDIMQSYEQYAADELNKLGVSARNQARAQYMNRNKGLRISHGVNSHDFKETKQWQTNEATTAIDFAKKGAIDYRYDEPNLEVKLATALQAVEILGANTGMSEDAIDANKLAVKSDIYKAALKAQIADGSLAASQSFEKWKDNLTAKDQEEVYSAVKNTERKYWANNTADSLFSLYPENPDKAFKETKKIENLADRDVAESELTARYSKANSVKNQVQNNLMDGFFDSVAESIKGGSVPTEALIPDGLDGKNYLGAKSYIAQMAVKGDVDTDNAAYLELYDIRNNNAQEFSKMNLAQYRPYLSDSDYKSFQKMQLDIKSLTPTQLRDDDKIIQRGLEVLGFKIGKDGTPKNNITIGKRTGALDEAFINAANAHIKEYELKHGKNIATEDISQMVYEFANSYNYEDPASKTKMYQLYSQGMNEQVGFTRAVLSDFEAAQKEKGRGLTDAEKYRIVSDRVSKTVQEQNNVLLNSVSPSLQRQPKVGDIWQEHKITSVFGNRTAPTAGASTNHKGIDLAYFNNEPFKAFASGTVINAGFDKGLGNFIDIKSSDGSIHRYAHANKISKTIGSVVQAGDLIGQAGSTGVSSGPHLHYEVIKNGKSINPLAPQTQVAQAQNEAIKGMNQLIATDARGNRALVEVNSSGQIVRVIKEL